MTAELDAARRRLDERTALNNHLADWALDIRQRLFASTDSHPIEAEARGFIRLCRTRDRADKRKARRERKQQRQSLIAESQPC